MNKYDRMLAVNKQASEAKIEKARREIVRMVDDGEKVSIQKLMERTSLSSKGKSTTPSTTASPTAIPSRFMPEAV